MVVKRDGGRIGVTVFAALLFSGCASSPSTDQEHGAAAAPPYRYGVSWGPAGRGGAVERGTDYIHVLHRGKSYFIRNAPVLESSRTTPRPEPKFPPIPDQRAGIAKLIDGIISVIEAAPRPDFPADPTSTDKLRNAWKRYCRGGEGLTEGDWDILREAGTPENVPPDLAATCIPPK